MMITFRVSLTDVKDDTEEYYSKKVKKVFEAPKGPKGRWWWLTSSNETKAALALRDDDDTKSLSLPCARKRGGLFGPKASFLSSQSRVLFCGIQIHFPHHYWSSNVASSSPAAGTTTRALFFPSLSLSLSLSLRFLPLRAVRRLFCRVRAFGTGSFLRRWRDGGGEVFDAEVSNHHHHHHHHHLLLSSFTTSRPMIAHQ